MFQKIIGHRGNLPKHGWGTRLKFLRYSWSKAWGIVETWLRDVWCIIFARLIPYHMIQPLGIIKLMAPAPTMPWLCPIDPTMPCDQIIPWPFPNFTSQPYLSTVWPNFATTIPNHAQNFFFFWPHPCPTLPKICFGTLPNYRWGLHEFPGDWLVTPKIHV